MSQSANGNGNGNGNTASLCGWRHKTADIPSGLFNVPPKRPIIVPQKRNAETVIRQQGRRKAQQFDDLGSSLQKFVADRAPDPAGLEDVEIKNFWAKVRAQNSDIQLDLTVTVATMRRIILAGYNKRQKELKLRRLSRLSAARVKK